MDNTFEGNSFIVDNALENDPIIAEIAFGGNPVGGMMPRRWS